MKKILFLPLCICFVQCSTSAEPVNKKEQELSCKLTTPELQERKATVIAQLREMVREKKELKDGYSFRFSGNDKTIDLLTDFVKSERKCCDFFSFGINIVDTGTIWFDITGGEGAKEFIKTEMEL